MTETPATLATVHYEVWNKNTVTMLDDCDTREEADDLLKEEEAALGMDAGDFVVLADQG